MDEALVVRARQGDQDAFEALAVAHHTRLYRVARGILRDGHLAEDATQQAFLDIWRNLGRLEDASRFEGWSYRLLVHACYAEARRKPRWAPEIDLHDPRVPVAPDPYGPVVDRDLLERGFRRLSVEHRTVIVLRCLLDMPMDEVAETLGVPVGTVGSRLNRAVSALRAALQSESRPVVHPPVHQGVSR
jgi:RNA polymerase sigma-70 factor (ECF subfamily)